MRLLDTIYDGRLFDAEMGSTEGGTLPPPDTLPPHVDTEPGNVSSDIPPVEPPPVPPEPPKRAPWWQPRIDQLTRRAHEAERALEAERQLRLEAEQRIASGGQASPDLRKLTEEEINQRAQAIAAAQTFTERCNNVVAKGKVEFPDFMAAVDTLVKDLGGMSQPFIEAALETPNPPKLIYHLGKNPDVAAEIMGMSPVRQAVALTRYAMELEKGTNAPADAPPKAQVTNAPPPIIPKVAGRVKAEPSLDDPELSTEEWMRLREKQLKMARQA